jgi:hypothetical protein
MKTIIKINIVLGILILLLSCNQKKTDDFDEIEMIAYHSLDVGIFFRLYAVIKSDYKCQAIFNDSRGRFYKKFNLAKNLLTPIIDDVHLHRCDSTLYDTTIPRVYDGPKVYLIFHHGNSFYKKMFICNSNSSYRKLFETIDSLRMDTENKISVELKDTLNIVKRRDFLLNTIYHRDRSKTKR